MGKWLDYGFCPFLRMVQRTILSIKETNTKSLLRSLASQACTRKCILICILASVALSLTVLSLPFTSLKHKGRLNEYRPKISRFNREHFMTNFTRKEYNGSIPKIIHQIWNDDVIPTELVDCVQSVIKYNPYPTWQYYFWTTENGRELIRLKYPRLLPFYDAIGPLYKADVLRIAIMYEYGGVYLDLDVVGVRPLDSFLNNHKCAVVSSPPEHILVYWFVPEVRPINNAIFLCHPGHFYFDAIIKHLEQKPLNCSNIQNCTGPVFVGNTYEELYVDLSKRDKMPVVTDYYLFHDMYDHSINDALENICKHNSYSKLTNFRKDICDTWVARGKHLREIHEKAYFYHLWHHSAELKLRKNPKNDIRNIVPHVKIINKFETWFSSILYVYTYPWR